MPTINRSGVEIFYSTVGSGPPVLWHTGGGGDGSMWQTAGYLDALPGRCHILLDHRGHGRSGKPKDLAAHRVDEYIADVLAVLDAAAGGKAVAVGYSDGGYLLYVLASRYPDRIAALVGIGGVARAGDTNDWRYGIADATRKSGLRRYAQQMSDREPQPAPPWLIENLCQTSDEMFALELEGWADGPLEADTFPLIQAPTLILCGSREDAGNAVEEALKVLPSGEKAVIPDFGHLQAFWRTDVTAPIIRDFLGRHAPV